MTSPTKSSNNSLSRLGFILVTAGSAVGLGNIWRFPYLVSKYDGATFIITYLFFALIIGLSILIGEYIIGRFIGNPLLDNLHKLKYSHIFGKFFYIHLIVAFTVCCFYFVVAGWSLYYFINSLTGIIQYSDASNNQYYQNVLDSLLANPWIMTIFAIIFLLATILVNYKGLVNGVEKVNTIFIPLLFIILITLIIKICMLSDNSGIVDYFFHFSFSNISLDLIIAALGQAFFSLSICMGTMIILASYSGKKYNLKSSAFYTVIVDSCIGILTAFLIIGAALVFNHKLDSGPGLTFLVIPQIFSELPFGNLFAALFFLMMIIAALTSTLSIIETMLPYVTKIFNKGRNQALIIIVLALVPMIIIESMSFNILSGITVFDVSIFDFTADKLLNVLMLISGLLSIAVLILGISAKDIKQEITNNGSLEFMLFPAWLITVRYIAPFVVIYTILSVLI